MRVAFRVDAGGIIGNGHLLRCLTLADALAEAGTRCLFVSRRMPPALLALLGEHGHSLEMLPDGDSDPTGIAETIWPSARQQEDSRRTSEILAGYSADWLVVDHYGLDAAWERNVRDHARCLLAIDDLANRAHVCDLLLDQNFHMDAGDRYAGLLPGDCIQLLGPRFALLRPTFAERRAKLRARDGRLRRLLVFFGGADGGAATLKTLEALSGFQPSALHVDVVAGAGNAGYPAIASACRFLPMVRCRETVDDMASLMAKVDLMIGAGGTTTWERCCLGLPAVVATIAENQRALTRAVATHGAQIDLGPAVDSTPEIIREAVTVLAEDPQRLRAMSERAMCLVDGRGRRRVADRMMRLRM